jgi:NADPH:quinone reductase-like Zn-dependent oxidoreductase
MSAVEAAAFCISFHTSIAGLKLRAGLQSGEVLLVHGVASNQRHLLRSTGLSA